MNINELTIGELRQIAALARGLDGSPSTPSTTHPLLGHKVFIRTVTAHHTGLLVDVTAHDLVLESAAWIADDGRFTQALADGTLNEVEPFPAGRVYVNRGAVVDLCEWAHELPTGQK